MGHDDALEATVEVAEDGLLGVVGNAGDGGDAEGLGGADHVLDLVEGSGAVLAVDHDEVVAEGAEDLDHVGSVAGDDAAEDDVAFAELGLGGVGAHGGVSFVLCGGRERGTLPHPNLPPEGEGIAAMVYYKEPSMMTSKRAGLPEATARSTAGLIWEGSVMRSPWTPMLLAIDAMSKGAAKSE